MRDIIHFYRVENLEKTREFYQSVLGFTLWKDQGKCLIYDANEKGKIGFCEHFPKSKSGNSCITFVFDCKADVDRWYDILKEKGFNVETPSENSFFEIYHFFVLDPNGITLEFQHFLTS